MKRLFIIIVSILWGYMSQAQGKGKMDISTDCPDIRYCNDCGEQKAGFKDKLTEFFERGINFRDLDIISGAIVIQLVVDSEGNACTMAMYNRTVNEDEEIARLELDKIVSHMPPWNPAVFNGAPVNSSVLIAIYSHVNDHGTFEVNYLRADKDKKWVVTDNNGAKIMLYFDEITKRTGE